MIHKVIIEPIFRTNSKFFPFRKEDFVVQTKIFELGFKVTNNGNEPIKGFTLENVSLQSAEGQNITHRVDNSFHIDTLNPKDIKEIWVEKFGTYMSGLTSITMNLKPDENNKTIKTYQKDKFTKEISEYPGANNTWLDFFYIQTRVEDTQNNSNSLSIFLTYFLVILTGFQLFLFYKYQIVPVIYQQEKNKSEAQLFCKNNPTSTWPDAKGGAISCPEILKL